MRRLHWICLSFLVAVWIDPAAAQVLYGTLRGVVVDPGQSVIPGASVTIENKDTGGSQTATTNAVGAYSFVDALPGTYTLTVSAPGFKQFTQTGVAVTINTVTRVDVQLELGAVTEKVEVAATAAALQTDKADVHVDLNTREVSELPLPVYRNYQSLINLVPGATPAIYQNAVIASPGRALATNINGTTITSNNTRLDGATNIRPQLSHQILYVPPAESIDSVNISTNNFDAEQGFAGGAAITVTTKSGTNQLHGAGFEYLTNSRTSAKNFFFLDKNIPKNIINNFGGTLGGPIKKDKLFFFGSYEALRERGTFNELTTLPTIAERAGDFSGLGTTLYDPFTGNPNGSGRQPFTNAIIPTSRQSSITRKVQDLVPLPNQPGAVSNYFAAAPTVFNRGNYDMKVNWSPTDKTTAWIKYSAMKANVISQFSLGQAGGIGMINGGGAGNGDVLVQVATIGGTHIFTPAFLMDGTISFGRDSVSVLGPDMGTNYGLDVFGIPGTNGPEFRQSGLPRFSIAGFEVYGNGHDWLPKILNDENFTYTANFTWTHAAHELRFGADIARYRLNHWHPETNSPRGAFDFSGGVTALNGGPSPNQFNAYAAFLLGLPIDVGKSLQFFSPMSPREWQEGYYLRDRWQATRHLTLTLGLRWEYYPLMTLAHNGISRYDPATNQVLVGGFGQIPEDAGTAVSKHLFAPRTGLAYRIGSQTVIRAGYGISIDPTPVSRTMLFAYPSVISQTFVSPNSFTPYGPIANGIPAFGGPDLSTGRINIPGTVSDTTLPGGFYTRGYVQSFNFMVERQLPGHIAGSAGYVGTRTVHQDSNVNINAAAPGGGTAGRPLYALFGRSADTSLINGFQPSKYDALQLMGDRSLAKGVLIKVAYTWSKAIDWTDDSGGGLLFNAPSAMPRNRALAGFDRTQNLRVAWLADLPFGAGRRWAGNGLGRKLLGGWQINGIFSAYSGTPFSVTASGASLNAPGNSQTADQVLPEVKKLGGIGPLQPYFDPLAFRAVTDVRFGTSGRNILRGPGLINTDLGLFREFPVKERVKMQFRAEAFNFTNTPHFGNPSANASNLRLNNDGSIASLGGFMTITSTAGGGGSLNPEGGPRQLRFALRVSF